jgi:5-methylcytosine-specific restriction enzyme subunit McrC
MASPALSAGALQAPGLLFDMNKLFEAHAVRMEEIGSGNERIVRTQGPQLHLATRAKDEMFLLKPDITVWHIGADGAASSIDRVVDAKWKRVDPHAPAFGVDEADVYQLMAYALRYGCTTLELVYPMPHDLAGETLAPVFDINLAHLGASGSVKVQVKLIPLWS